MTSTMFFKIINVEQLFGYMAAVLLGHYTGTMTSTFFPDSDVEQLLSYMANSSPRNMRSLPPYVLYYLHNIISFCCLHTYIAGMYT